MSEIESNKKEQIQKEETHLIIVKNAADVWSAMELDTQGNISFVPIQLHTLQNLMHNLGCSPTCINANTFIELTKPHCVLPFEPK